jgi:hypothetical protein
MRPEIAEIIDELNRLDASEGVITEEVVHLLDRAWALLGYDLTSETDTIADDDLPHLDSIDDFIRLQEEIDIEILDMLDSKLTELDSAAGARALTKEELAARAAIVSFRAEMQSDIEKTW